MVTYEVHGTDILVMQTGGSGKGEVKVLKKVQEQGHFMSFFFSDVRILIALWACLKEQGVRVLFLKSHHYGMSPFLF